MRSAVVFDLDGTLVETAPDLHLVLSEVMAEEGHTAPPIEAMRHMVGDGARVLLERALTTEGLQVGPAELDRLYARFLAIYTAAPCRASHLYDGAAESLRTLAARGHALGLCTNKPQGPSVGLLESLGVAGHFGAVIGGDVLAVRKPDPGHLAAVLERLGSGVERAVMVGDSRNDLLAARNLGIPCILVSFGYTPVPARDLGADLVIDSFDELAPAIGHLLPAA